MKSSHRKGAVLPLIAIMLPVLLILSGFAINLAYIQLTATEIQISTDAAARAAGRAFTKTQDPNAALDAANDAGVLNPVAGTSLQFNLSDLEIGHSTRNKTNSRYDFAPSGDGTGNSIRLVGNRTGTQSIATFFPSLMGAEKFELASEAISTQMEVDIALVFDRSGSMAYADNEIAVYPPIPKAAPAGWDFGDPAPPDSRWRDAIEATKVFLLDLVDSPMLEQVSLATYADSGKINKDLTTNYNETLAGLKVYTDGLTGGGTNIAGGLQAGGASLTSPKARPFAAKVVIVMTDGKQTTGPDSLAMAESLANDGVLIIAITFSNEADQSLMKQIAETGNGFHAHAKTKKDLKAIFKQLSGNLPTLLTK